MHRSQTTYQNFIIPQTNLCSSFHFQHLLLFYMTLLGSIGTFKPEKSTFYTSGRFRTVSSVGDHPFRTYNTVPGFEYPSFQTATGVTLLLLILRRFIGSVVGDFSTLIQIIKIPFIFNLLNTLVSFIVFICTKIFKLHLVCILYVIHKSFLYRQLWSTSMFIAVSIS